MKLQLYRAISLFLLLSLLLSLVACSSGGGSSELGELPKLSAPVVTLIENVASWAPNPNAAKFEIAVNGTVHDLPNTASSYTLADGESLRVRAVGDGVTSATGDWSPAVAYTPVHLFHILWKSDGMVLGQSDVVEGRVPMYDGVRPTRPDNELFSYEFSGWSPTVSPASSDRTYLATYTEIPKQVVSYDSGFSEKRIDATYEYDYDSFDLTVLSKYMKQGYRFRFEISVYMYEVYEGYQEIYLLNDLAARLGSIGPNFAHGGDGRDDWEWNSFTVEVGGEYCTRTMRLRYGAHGKFSDDWIRGRATVRVTVLYD